MPSTLWPALPQAARSLRPACRRIAGVNTASHPLPTTAFGHRTTARLLTGKAFSSIRYNSPVLPSDRKPNFFCSSTIQARHCSHRSNMCRRGAAETSSAMDISKGREVLPKNVKPLHYDIVLDPDLEVWKFAGQVTIDLEVVADTTSITLNSLEIDIQAAKVIAGGESIDLPPKNISYDEDKQTATIAIDQSLPAGSTAQLWLSFEGILNDKMAGFYRSRYTNEQGEQKYMATTQFEATDARRALPCFDEPALKATYTVTLIAEPHLTCLSNMDVESRAEIDSKTTSKKKQVVRFNKSPPFSTYLLAFIIGEFKVFECNDFRIPVRTFVTPDKNPEHGRYAAELGAKTLAFYEKEFDIKYPLPKMDQVAVPDFSAGAMENWGLVTYREIAILLDEKNSSASVKSRIAETVQHELAHQWFGNLVTMDFWDGLWLNEGFATWMSWYSCNVFYPEWKVWEGYVTDNLQAALGLDSLRNSHPVEVPVFRADEINQIFDDISYAKGSSIIRMISKYLGEDVFMEGIRRYLKKHAYGNTTTEDLWESLSDASGKDVVRLADIWTKHVGFPVLSVTENAQDQSIHVKQNRFLRTADVKPEEDQTIYPVVLGLRTKDGVDSSAVLDQREANFTLPDLEFFKINADQSGVYRTSYTEDRLRKLGKNAKAGLLTVEDRAGMIADAGALSGAGYQKTTGLLSLLKSFETEPEFVVWDEITARVGSVRAAWTFEDDKVKDALKAFQRDLASPKAHELGWDFKESDGHIEQQFKALMFGSAASAGDEETKAAAFDMFNKYIAGDRQALHANIRGSVYAVVLQYGGVKEYEAIQKEYETAKGSEERITALRSLGRARSPELIKRTIEYAFSPKVKYQDIYVPLSSLRAHREGIETLWSWMKDHWDLVKQRMPPTFSMLGTVVAFATAGFTKEEQLQDVTAFYADKNTQGFDRNLAQSKDAIQAKISWLERDAADVQTWLKENKYF